MSHKRTLSHCTNSISHKASSISHTRHHSVSFIEIINKLPILSDFEATVKVLQDRIDGKIGIVKSMIDGRIYATKHIATPTIIEQKEVIEEFELVRDLKLLGYHALYNDIDNKSMIIIQDYLSCNLLQYICNNNIKNKNKRLSKSDILYPHLNEMEAKHIALSILYKLKKMHKYGFIHCDIKPENIMKLTSLNNNNYNKHDFNDWRLIDFGLRTRFNINRGYSQNSWRGTIGWTPPELIPNNGCNNRIYPELDVWCIGLVILYMVIGQNPFELTLNECKENKLYSLEKGKTYWFYNKLLTFNKNKKWNHYLLFLHKKNKISLNLLDLLLHHMLVFDVKKRSNVKTILKHQWFKDVVKIKNINNQKKFIISK